MAWQYFFTFIVLMTAAAFADPTTIDVSPNATMLSILSIIAIVVCYIEQRKYLFVDKTRSRVRYAVATTYMIVAVILSMAAIDLMIFCTDKYYAAVSLFASSLSFTVACVIATFGQPRKK
jgi:hypothetical protein